MPTCHTFDTVFAANNTVVCTNPCLDGTSWKQLKQGSELTQITSCWLSKTYSPSSVIVQMWSIQKSEVHYRFYLLYANAGPLSLWLEVFSPLPTLGGQLVCGTGRTFTSL